MGVKKASSRPERLFLSVGCGSFRSTQLGELQANADVYTFTRLAKNTSFGQQTYQMLNPERQEALDWLRQRVQDWSPRASEDAVLIVFLSTHGFESAGETYLAWKDSTLDAPNTLTSLRELQSALSSWFPAASRSPTQDTKPKSQRCALLFLQTCRSPLPMEGIQHPAEPQRGAWWILHAVETGSEEGWESSSPQERENFSASGRLTRRFCSVWEDLQEEQTFPDYFMRELGRVYNGEGLTPPPLLSFGKPQPITWRPRKTSTQKPPKHFEGHLFEALSDEKKLFGRDAALRAAFGVRLDRDVPKVGWLYEEKEKRTLLYGPSGAGKTSLVRAGLLPKLEKLHPSAVLYVDLSVGEMPTIEKQNKLNFLFLDQVEGHLTDGRFKELVACIQRCERNNVRVVVLLREEFVGSWEGLWRKVKGDWSFVHRFLAPLTRKEAQEVLGGMLPSSCLSLDERKRLLTEVGLASTRTASESTVDSYSPILLQIAMTDAWERRGLEKGSRVRSLSSWWEEHWTQVIKQAPAGKETLLGILSVFVPLDHKQLAARRSFTEQGLITWLTARGLNANELQESCGFLVEKHWLRKVGENYILSHDVLLSFLARNLEENESERKRRTFLRRLQEAFGEAGTQSAALETILRQQFSPSELGRLRREVAFWRGWLRLENPQQSDTYLERFPDVLNSLLRSRRLRFLQVLVVFTFGFILFYIVWNGKSSIEDEFRDKIERCTESQNENLPYHLFEQCTEALVDLEKWPFRQDFANKIIVLFQTFQTKKVPLEWWNDVFSDLKETRNLFLKGVSRPMEAEHGRAWRYLLRISLHKKTLWNLTQEERLFFFPIAKDPEGYLAAAILWKRSLHKGKQTTEEERSVWLDMLKHAKPEVQREALDLFYVWIEKGGNLTKREQNALLEMLGHSNIKAKSLFYKYMRWIRKAKKSIGNELLSVFKQMDTDVQMNILFLWFQRLEKGGKSTEKERKSFQKMFLYPLFRMSSTALKGWFKWLVNGENPTGKERDTALKLLEDSEPKVRLSALKLWEKWVEKGGKLKKTERGMFMNMLNDSDNHVYRSTFELWYKWADEGDQPTEEERVIFLKMLKNSAPRVRYAILMLWGKWIENKQGRFSFVSRPRSFVNFTEKERRILLKMLNDSDHSVRIAAREFWLKYLEKKENLTSEERDILFKMTSDLDAKVRIAAIYILQRSIEKVKESSNIELNFLDKKPTKEQITLSEKLKDYLDKLIKQVEKPTKEERSALSEKLKDDNARVHLANSDFWGEWIKKNKKLMEKKISILLDMLNNSEHWLSLAMFNLLGKWIEKGGKLTEKERKILWKMLKRSNYWARFVSLELLSKWIEKGEKLTEKERKILLAMLKDTDGGVRHAALKILSKWIELLSKWIEEGGKLTEKENSILLDILKDSDDSMRQSALKLLSKWIEKGEKLTKKERSILLDMLKDSDNYVCFASLGLLSKWIEKSGKLTKKEREILFAMLKSSDFWRRRLAIKLLDKWIEKVRKLNEKERKILWKMLKDTDDGVRHAAFEFWLKWIEKSGKPTEKQQGILLEMLNNSHARTRVAVLGVWLKLVEKGGKPTEKQRDRLLEMLEDSNFFICHAALKVWLKLVEKGGKPTEKQQSTFLKLRGDFDRDVHRATLRARRMLGGTHALSTHLFTAASLLSRASTTKPLFSPTSLPISLPTSRAK